MITFDVPGTPAPQGSMVRNRYGGVRADNPATMPWRNAVAAAAAKAMNGQPPIAGPTSLSVVFSFARPKSHYRTGRHAGQLKASAPMFCAVKPDVDKLLRAIGDALTGVAVVDDSLIAQTFGRKVYGIPGVSVRVEELADVAAHMAEIEAEER